MKLLLILLLLLVIGTVYGSAFLNVVAGSIIRRKKQNSFSISWTRRRREVVPLSLSASTEEGANDNMSESDKERLLLTEPALNAFIVAEMRDFVTKSVEDWDRRDGGNSNRKWRMKTQDKIALGILDENGTILDDGYVKTMDGTLAVDLICNATADAFRDGYRQQGLLSALGSAICYFRDFYRNPRLVAACERVGLSDYVVAHHITDMYHHRTLRGAYTKTLAPSGKGEVAARLAVGLSPEQNVKSGKDDGETDECGDREDDECLLWSPTTPGVCLHWKSDDEAWRKRRFERVQMEGTRDPRRGGSGTTR